MALRKRDIDALVWSSERLSRHGTTTKTQITWNSDGTGSAEALPGLGVIVHRSGRKCYIINTEFGDTELIAE